MHTKIVVASKDFIKEVSETKKTVLATLQLKVIYDKVLEKMKVVERAACLPCRCRSAGRPLRSQVTLRTAQLPSFVLVPDAHLRVVSASLLEFVVSKLLTTPIGSCWVISWHPA